MGGVRLTRSGRLSSKLKAERGGAMVELAVALPFLILLAIGAVDYGRIHNTTILVANAARAGAQYGAQNTATSGDNAGMIAAARNDAGDATLNVVPSRFCKCPDGGTPNCATGACAGFGVPEVFVKDSVKKTATMILRYPGLPQSVDIVNTVILRVQ